MMEGGLLSTYIMLFLSLNRSNAFFYYESYEKMYMIAYHVGATNELKNLDWIKINTNKEIRLPLRVVEQLYNRMARGGNLNSKITIGKDECPLFIVQNALDESRREIEKIFVEIGKAFDLPNVLPEAQSMSDDELM